MGNKDKEIRFSQLTAGPYAFRWARASDGYELINGEEIQSRGQEVESYAPLAESTLHRKFADLSDDDGILGFATKYGLLGQQDLPSSESVGHWRVEIDNMKAMVGLWDLVRKQEVGKLRKSVKWISDNHLQIDTKGRRSIIYKDKELVGEGERGDVIEPARRYVCREVNKHLKGHVSPQVFPSRRDEVYFVPDTLLSAMWLLFFTEITGQAETVLCPVCATWKEVSTSRQRYCSNACKQEAYRRRKRARREVQLSSGKPQQRRTK